MDYISISYVPIKAYRQQFSQTIDIKALQSQGTTKNQAFKESSRVEHKQRFYFIMYNECPISSFLASSLLVTKIIRKVKLIRKVP